MDHERVEAILFDSGGVLIGPRGGRWNPRFDFEDIVTRAAPQLTEADIAAAVVAGDEFLASSDTTPSRDDYHRVLLRTLGIDPSDALLDELGRTLDPADVVEPYPEVVDVLDNLQRRGIRMAVVSDNWATLPDLHEGVGLGGYFEMYAISEVLGCNKPDPRMYRYASDRLGLEPSACLFVDDHGPHVEAALSLGYQGVVVARDGGRPPSDVPTVTNLRELLQALHL